MSHTLLRKLYSLVPSGIRIKSDKGESLSQHLESSFALDRLRIEEKAVLGVFLERGGQPLTKREVSKKFADILASRDIISSNDQGYYLSQFQWLRIKDRGDEYLPALQHIRKQNNNKKKKRIIVHQSNWMKRH